jgi:hypothetical protein
MSTASAIPRSGIEGAFLFYAPQEGAEDCSEYLSECFSRVYPGSRVINFDTRVNKHPVAGHSVRFPPGHSILSGLPPEFDLQAYTGSVISLRQEQAR